jgi:cysteine desulfuration protein SufE
VEGLPISVVAGREKTDSNGFTADSDAILTRGIILILIQTFSNQKRFCYSRTVDFIDAIGLKEHLSTYLYFQD